jgi:hypothetical protein
MASSAIPLTPRTSPTAFVTKSTIYKPKSETLNHPLRKEADHSWQNVCQGPGELKHDDHDGDGDAHDATAQSIAISNHIERGAPSATYLRAAAAPRNA